MGRSADEPRCVACEEPLVNNNHHCDEKRIKSIESHRKRYDTNGRQQPRSLHSRLSEGFAMLNGKVVY